MIGNHDHYFVRLPDGERRARSNGSTNSVRLRACLIVFVLAGARP